MIVERLVKTWTSCTDGLAIRSWLFNGKGQMQKFSQHLINFLSMNEQFFLPFLTQWVCLGGWFGCLGVRQWNFGGLYKAGLFIFGIFVNSVHSRNQYGLNCCECSFHVVCSS